MKIKMHSIRAAKKRLFRISNGNFKRWRAFTSHLAFNKTTRTKRYLKKKTFLCKSDLKRFKKAVI